jgi:hypothetical protein
MREERHEHSLRGRRLWLLGVNFLIAGCAAAGIAALKEPPENRTELIWLRVAPPVALMLAGSLLVILDAARWWNQRE